jgi:hypothetical protein
MEIGDDYWNDNIGYYLDWFWKLPNRGDINNRDLDASDEFAFKNPRNFVEIIEFESKW